MQTRRRRASARTRTDSNHRACAGVVAMGCFLLQEAKVRFPAPLALRRKGTDVVMSPCNCRRGAEDMYGGVELIVYNYREKTNHPIFTMFLASQKVYVVNSPNLISQINRRQKVIDSDAFFVNVVMGKLFGFRDDDLAELSRDAGEKGTLRRDSKVLEHSLLERGAVPLDEIFGMIVGGVADRLSTTAREGSVTISLQAWLRELFTLSTADGLFGAQNPFTQDPDLLDDFWYGSCYPHYIFDGDFQLTSA